MKHIKWLVVLLITLVAGCAGEAEELPEEPKQTEKVTIMETGGWSETDGGFLIKLPITDRADCLVYFDYATKLLVPFCTKVDCSHNVTNTEAKTCTAAILGEDCSSYCGIYGGKLWYLKVLDLEHTAVYCADVTGENVQEMFVVDFFPRLGDVIIYDNAMYVATQKNKVNDYGVITGNILSLIRVSLEDGSKTVILPERDEEEASYFIYGFYDGKVYFRYYRCEEFPQGGFGFYDCKTGEVGFVPLPDVTINLADMYGQHVVYRREEKGKYFLEVFDLKQNKVVDRVKVNHDISSMRVYDDELLFIVEEEGYYRYDFATNTAEKIGDEHLPDQYWPFWPTGEGYLVKMIENHMSTEFGYITREDFENGGKPIVLTEDKRPIW